MQITPKDLSNITILKSTPEGDIIQARTFGGLNIVLLRRKSGELEFLSHAATEIRSQALAAKKYPRLGIPIIVKSQDDNNSTLEAQKMMSDEELNKPMNHLTPDEEREAVKNQKNAAAEKKRELMRILQSKGKGVP